MYNILKYLNSIFLKYLTLKYSILFFIIYPIKTKLTTICAVIVAIPAPFVPRAGIGPNPKINSGSNIIFAISPIVLILNGIELFPSPIKIDVNTGFIK